MRELYRRCLRIDPSSNFTHLHTALQPEPPDARKALGGLRRCHQNRHGATMRAIRRARNPQGAAQRQIQRAESTERVARTKSKPAPRYSECDPTRANSAEGCASPKTCFRLSDILSAKWAPRYSQSDPTRAKVARGLRLQTWRRHRATTRLKKSEFWPRSASQYEMWFFDVWWRKYCAFQFHEKKNPRHTKSCYCHAKWCQHSRSKFDDSFTKRAFRALQDRLQERVILRLPRKMEILTFRAFPTNRHDAKSQVSLAMIRLEAILTARQLPGKILNQKKAIPSMLIGSAHLLLKRVSSEVSNRQLGIRRPATQGSGAQPIHPTALEILENTKGFWLWACWAHVAKSWTVRARICRQGSLARWLCLALQGNWTGPP